MLFLIKILIFLDQEFRRSVAFSFLDKMRSKFETQFGSQLSAAIPFAMNSEFAPILATEMKRANAIGAKEPVTSSSENSQYATS